MKSLEVMSIFATDSSLKHLSADPKMHGALGLGTRGVLIRDCLYRRGLRAFVTGGVILRCPNKLLFSATAPRSFEPLNHKFNLHVQPMGEL